MHPTQWTQRSQTVEDEINKSFVRNKKQKKKKKNKVLDFVKLEYYKEVLDSHGAIMHPTQWTQRSQTVEDEINKSFVRNKKQKKKKQGT